MAAKENDEVRKDSTNDSLRKANWRNHSDADDSAVFFIKSVKNTKKHIISLDCNILSSTSWHCQCNQQERQNEN